MRDAAAVAMICDGQPRLPLTRHQAALVAFALEALRRGWEHPAARLDLTEQYSELETELLGFVRATGLRASLAPRPLAPADVVTVQQAAKIRGCSPQAIRKAIQAGRLPARRPGREWLIDAAAVHRLAGRRERDGLDERRRFEAAADVRTAGQDRRCERPEVGRTVG